MYFSLLLKIKHADTTRKFVPQRKPEIQLKITQVSIIVLPSFSFWIKYFPFSASVWTAFYSSKAVLQITRQPELKNGLQWHVGNQLTNGWNANSRFVIAYLSRDVDLNLDSDVTERCSPRASASWRTLNHKWTNTKLCGRCVTLTLTHTVHLLCTHLALKIGCFALGCHPHLRHKRAAAEHLQDDVFRL